MNCSHQVKRFSKVNVTLSVYIIMASIFFSCKKETKESDEKESPVLNIIDLKDYQQFYQLDTIIIKYELNEFEFDSICLFINNKLAQIQQIPENEFIFIADSVGEFRIALKAYNDSKIQASDIRTINVNKTYNNIDLILRCYTIDGDQNCFLGDELAIHVEPKYEIGWEQITKYKEITFYLNGIDLGTKYTLPFVFESGVINQTENTVKLKLVDEENHIYFEELQLMVYANTPPEIEYEHKYQYGVHPGYYYSIDSVIFSTDGSDNVNVHYLEYYVDDNLIMTDSVNSNYFHFREFNVGLLPAGEHTSYCIAYDDRGASTTSETLNFIVYGAVQIDQDMIELERTSDANIVYAITSSILYKINPGNEDVEEQFTLPYQDASCIKYDNETNRLYIGFQDGKIVCFDESSNEFTTISSSAIPEIVDLEIDNELNRAFVVSNEKILLIDLLSNSVLDEFSSSEDINSLAIDSQSKIIIASANPNSSGGYLYKLNYTSTSITLDQQLYGIGFPIKILFKNNYDVFTVLTYGSNSLRSYYSSDLSVVGTYSDYNVGTGSYSSDGVSFYMDNGFEDVINFFNTSDFSKYKTCYLPLDGYNNIEFLTTNADDSKLIVLTDNTFYDYVKLVFIEL